MTISFSAIPTDSQWHNASNVTFAVRKSDIVLNRIDKLIHWYNKEKDKTQKMIMTCDIYFTTDYWLKIYTTNSVMERGRAPAVYALFERAVHLLCDTFKCTINGLPRELELLWGRDLTKCGVHVDDQQGIAEYITRAEAARYRIWFKGGKAYEVIDGKKQLADSKNSYVPEAMVRGCLPAVDYGFFVLTMSRDLYMAKHRKYEPAINQPGFYHSSYVAGSPVQCSGTMLIRNGVIEAIRLNSGHYQPHANNARALIMALGMWGVSLKTVKFEDFRGNPLAGDGGVMAVVNATNAPGALDKGREATIDSNTAGFMAKPVDRSLQPDPRLQWPNRPMYDKGKVLPQDFSYTQPPAINRHLPA